MEDGDEAVYRGIPANFQEGSNPARNASDILKILDQRFFDHNRVQSARLAYHKLEMGSMTYNDFRIKFTQLATTGKI